MGPSRMMLRVMDTGALAYLFLAARHDHLALAAACALWVTWRWCFEAGDDA